MRSRRRASISAASSVPVRRLPPTRCFSGPHDFPYETALVDTAAGWAQKAKKPVAIVLVSQSSDGLAVVRVSGASTWTQTRRFDHKRKIYDTFLEVRRSELASFDEFVTWLKARVSAPGEN